MFLLSLNHHVTTQAYLRDIVSFVPDHCHKNEYRNKSEL